MPLMFLLVNRYCTIYIWVVQEYPKMIWNNHWLEDSGGTFPRLRCWIGSWTTSRLSLIPLPVKSPSSSPSVPSPSLFISRHILLFPLFFCFKWYIWFHLLPRSCTSVFIPAFHICCLPQSSFWPTSPKESRLLQQYLDPNTKYSITWFLFSASRLSPIFSSLVHTKAILPWTSSPLIENPLLNNLDGFYVFFYCCFVCGNLSHINYIRNLVYFYDIAEKNKKEKILELQNKFY